MVAAFPLFGCKDDGSDGDVGSLGFADEYINANSCRSTPPTATVMSSTDRENALRYVRGDTSVLPEINASMSNGGFSMSAGPLIGIGLGSGEQPNFEVSIDTAALKNFDFGNIVKIKNTRVSSFPEFIMEWVDRQIEEVINKLTTLPTLYIVLPDFSGFDIKDFTEFPSRLENAFNNAKNDDSKDYAADMLSTVTPGASDTAGGAFPPSPSEGVDSPAQVAQNSVNEAASKVGSTIQGAKDQYNSTILNNRDTINSLGKNISGIKAAYEFMSHLPLIKLQNEMVDISVPWMSLEEMNKWYVNAVLTLKQYQAEFDRAKTEWSKVQNPSELANNKIVIQTEGLIGSLQENIRIIDSYRKFPEKLQKYLTFKERYATQILCNVEAIEILMGGWLADNGKRFKTWVELYVLIKAILKSWQLIIDLFNIYNDTCAPCRNERWDLKHFIFKLISAIIPKIPIIQFPKWPDVWVDLHNIRAGLPIMMPALHVTFVPIVLPQLPRL